MVKHGMTSKIILSHNQIFRQMFGGIPRGIFDKDCKIEALTKSDAEKDSEPEKEFIDEQAALYRLTSIRSKLT